MDQSANLQESFATRHLGNSPEVAVAMARELGCDSVQDLVDEAVPNRIRRQAPFELPSALTEAEALERLRSLMAANQVRRSFLGQGYYDCLTPAVIQRNILENPGWYTAYTPYQAEISQGRLEACLNFQTLVCDLTGLDVANASLLDEATAAAEAMSMCAAFNLKAHRFFVARNCHPQTLAVLQTRGQPLGIELVMGSPAEAKLDESFFGVLIQVPDTEGRIEDYEALVQSAHEAGAKVVVLRICSR